MPPNRSAIDDVFRNVLQEVDPGLEDDLQKAESRASSPSAMRLSFNETLRASVARFGGPAGVANEYFNTYQSASDGSPVRAGIINNLMKAIQEYGEDSDFQDETSIASIEKELRDIAMEELLEKLPEALANEVKKHL